MTAYKLSYRHRNPSGGCPFFVDEDEFFSNRGAAEHRAEELELKGGVVVYGIKEVER